MNDHNDLVCQVSGPRGMSLRKDQYCPVCQASALLVASPLPREVWAGQRFLSVHCPECGAFLIEEGFLAHGWSTIAPEDKQALAVYLHATKDRSGCGREITVATWKRWAQLGKLLGHLVGTPCPHRRKNKSKRTTTSARRVASRARQLSSRLLSSKSWTN